MDDLCTGCGRDLLETDGNTFDTGEGDGTTVQLCPDCETGWRAEDDKED